MKKLVFLISIYLCSLSFASPIQDHKLDPVMLTQLAIGLDLPQNVDLVAETQKKWLRKSNQERWEMAELSPDKKLYVLNWARDQGLFTSWKPACETYDKAVILGGTTSRMQGRLNYLKQLWSEGIRFNEVVWLTGDRPLDQRIDGLMDRCCNESEAARILWEETDFPKEMRSLAVTFVATPMKVENSSFKRPNTEDTIISWLKVSPEPCKALFISDQPFCGYQFSLVKAILPDTFLFDFVGQGVDLSSESYGAAVTLDAIARWIYQEDLMTKLGT